MEQDTLIPVKKNLFLDDIRHPYDAFPYTKQTMFLHYVWEVVRSYDEFVAWITENGLPGIISFDHDLADEHYTPPQYWGSYELSKAYQDAQDYKEKTGYDCARWLTNYCMDNQLKCPRYFCHSMNPVGKSRIIGLLDSFWLSQEPA